MRIFLASFVSAIKRKKALWFLFTFLGFFAPGVTLAIGPVDTAFAVGIIGIPYLSQFIFRGFANFAADLLPQIINVVAKYTITKDFIFLAFWNIVKDWANILIVVALIAIAVATILNLESYRAKKLLPGIIIVALLVNFSVLFVGLGIDISNMLTNAFFNGTGNEPRQMVHIISIINTRAVDAAMLDLFNTDDPDWAMLFSVTGRVVMVIATFILLYVVVAFTFLIFGILMIVRYAVLSFLFIVSPLAFVFYFFPLAKAKDLFNTWWQSFIKWCFIGLGAAFCLKISKQMFDILNVTIQPNNTQITPLLVRILVPTIFLLIGLRSVMKASPKIAGAVMGISAAVGAAALAGGLAVGVGGAKAFGKGLSSLGDRETWNNLGGNVRSALSTVASAPFKKESWLAAGRGLRAAPGAFMAAPGAAIRGAKAGVNAIWQKTKGAYGAATSVDWKQGIDLAKQGLYVAPGALAATGRAAGTGVGFLAGTAVTGLGAALRGAGIFLSGKSNLKDKGVDWLGRLAEWSGALDQGTVDQWQQARMQKKMEEPKKRYRAVAAVSGLAVLAAMRNKTADPQEQAAIDSTLAENDALHLVGTEHSKAEIEKEANELAKKRGRTTTSIDREDARGELTRKKQQAAMDNAVRLGAAANDFTKNNADLVDVKKMRDFEVRYVRDVREGKMSPAEARLRAIKDAQASNFASMRIENIENMSDEDIAKEAKVRTARGAKFLHEATKRGILEMVDKDYEVVGELLQESSEKYRSNTLREAIKKTPGFKKFDRPAVEKRVQEMVATNPALALTPTINVNRMAEEQLIGEGYKGKIVDLSKTAMGDVAFLRNAKPEALVKQFDRLTASQFNELKKWISDPNQYNKMKAEYTRLKAAGRRTELLNLVRVFNRIKTAK